ncbi:membrane integrity-associated transporter subunit PqiC [Gluconacetobacter aggeris]|uniref:Membrane integrity-associated transporter subunit PqiC n=1 Tax=Gluconacetobacter aggeris TaxID=1286186 RepID=A0A7W4ITW8_9PROT|nr:membrane integrity-associated transporter subunit PqiC [Gluconacetobacter aggeris]
MRGYSPSRSAGDPTRVSCAPVLTAIKAAPLRCSETHAGRPASRPSRSADRLGEQPLPRRDQRVPAWLAGLVLPALLAACASPPVRFYTLGAPAIATGAVPVGAVTPATPTVAVARVTLPDYLDGQDLIARDGNRIERSATGRWASRLSLGATDLITARLAQSRTDLFVTDQPQILPATWRLAVNISRLDIAHDGTASLAADWSIIPHDEHQPLIHQRATLTRQGPATTDDQVATLTQSILDDLAERIAAGWPR